MNKPKAQGTAWETAFVRQAQDAGCLADRIPEAGMHDMGDVWIGDLPKRGHEHGDISVLAWSRLINNGTSRRIADGARSVVVMATDDFLKIAHLANVNGYAFVVECKATERLNVTRTLDQAQKKLRRWKER